LEKSNFWNYKLAKFAFVSDNNPFADKQNSSPADQPPLKSL